jgi:excisionase family DNA binding protein
MLDKITPLAVAPKVAAFMLGCGITHLYKLLNAGEIAGYLDGSSRRIATSSINDFIKRKIEAHSKPV